jgi:ABC-type glycerol-3-phosphate transport system permease component
MRAQRSPSPSGTAAQPGGVGGLVPRATSGVGGVADGPGAVRSHLTQARRRRTLVRRAIWQLGWQTVLLACCGVLLAPLAWLLSTSLKETGREFEYPPRWIPNPVVWSNYREALTGLPFHLFLRNTVVIEAATLAGTLLTASLVAFAFARLRYPGRDFWFIVLISTMMLPGVVTLVPHYVIFKTLGWIDTLLPLTVPAWFGGSPFYIFLIRQFFLTIPLELDEAARVDGASSLRIYAWILMPLSGPVLAAVAIFSFVSNWNAFLEPLIYLNSTNNFTLALGLRLFQTQYTGEWNLMMAAATTMIVPIIALFLVAQRYFTRGIVLTGLAGR